MNYRATFADGFLPASEHDEQPANAAPGTATASYKIDAAIFDFYGVLSCDRYWQKADLTHFERIQRRIFLKDADLADRWMRGKTASEQVCEILAASLSLNKDQLWTGLLESCRSFELQPGVRERIRALRKKMPVFLVTTNADCFTRFVVNSMGLASEFDEIVNSSDVGHLKEDAHGKIFTDLLSKVGVPINRVALFDDSLSVGSIFEALGGKHIPIEAGPLRAHDFDQIDEILIYL